jgi:DNA topoisomerase-1
MAALDSGGQWITTKTGDHVLIEPGKGTLRQQVQAHFAGMGREESKAQPKTLRERAAQARAKTAATDKAKPEPKTLRDRVSKAKEAGEKKPSKPKPTRGPMAEARREGKGKDARIVMADGGEPPAHISAAMIPPAYTDVRVSTDPKAEVLWTARDAKGRPKMDTVDSFKARSAAVKFARTDELVAKKDAILKQIHEARGNLKLKEEADAAWLMHEQATRPGSDADTKAKVKAYGATTLKAEHVVVSPQGVRLQFVGKEGIHHDHLIKDEKLGKMLVERKLTADERDGKIFATTDEKTRKFTATLDGGKFTPKDFRTAAANRAAIAEIQAKPEPAKTEKEYKQRVKEVSTKVSQLLGNRPKQAFDSYINPMVWNQWRPQP